MFQGHYAQIIKPPFSSACWKRYYIYCSTLWQPWSAIPFEQGALARRLHKLFSAVTVQETVGFWTASVGKKGHIKGGLSSGELSGEKLYCHYFMMSSLHEHERRALVTARRAATLRPPLRQPASVSWTGECVHSTLIQIPRAQWFIACFKYNDIWVKSNAHRTEALCHLPTLTCRKAHTCFL